MYGVVAIVRGTCFGGVLLLFPYEFQSHGTVLPRPNLTSVWVPRHHDRDPFNSLPFILERGESGVGGSPLCAQSIGVFEPQTSSLQLWPYVPG